MRWAVAAVALAAACAPEGDPPPIVAPLAPGPRRAELAPLQPSRAKAPPSARDQGAREGDELHVLCEETCARAADACAGYDVPRCERECDNKEVRSIFERCPGELRALFACMVVVGSCPAKVLRRPHCDTQANELLRCADIH